MNTITPIERIIKVLTDAEFRPLQTPLTIATIEFDIPAALLGSGSNPDLIVILDTVQDAEDRVLQKVEGIARALDVVQSLRPLTVVLAGPRPSVRALDSLARICRVLPVGTALSTEGEAPLRNWLAVLLPLNLPEPSGSIVDPTNELIARLNNKKDDPTMKLLISAATHGPVEVRSKFESIIAESLQQDISGEDS